MHNLGYRFLLIMRQEDDAQGRHARASTSEPDGGHYTKVTRPLTLQNIVVFNATKARHAVADRRPGVEQADAAGNP